MQIKWLVQGPRGCEQSGCDGLPMSGCRHALSCYVLLAAGGVGWTGGVRQSTSGLREGLPQEESCRTCWNRVGQADSRNDVVLV